MVAGLVAEAIVDPVFRKDRVRDAIERLRRREVAAERLFDDHPRVLGQVRGAEPLITVSKSEGGMAR